MMRITRFKAQQLENVSTRILEAAGCSTEEALCVARNLVDANLAGHDSHGVFRVARYVDFVDRGWVIPGATPDTALETDSMLVIDAKRAFGQVVGVQTMKQLAAKTKKAGIALSTIRNSAHLGRLGAWSEQLAREGLVSLHFMNTTGRGMVVVPFGGTDRRLSVNPLTIGVPLDARSPIIFDITTTVVAEGKIAVAKNKGEKLSPDTIVDKDGNPTTDPNDFYTGGALLPIAGHKGAGLNIVTDILAGALSGGGCTKPGVEDLAESMTSIAIDPSFLESREAFVAEVVRYCDWVKGSPPKDPEKPVLLPGEMEAKTRKEREAEGIPIDSETWEQLLKTGERVGLERHLLSSLGG